MRRIGIWRRLSLPGRGRRRSSRGSFRVACRQRRCTVDRLTVSSCFHSSGVTTSSPSASARIKGRAWQPAWSLLTAAARLFPGHIGTHLIVGLGERESELLATAAALLQRGIMTGVFAFTPVRGTRLEDAAPPPIESYRRIQAAFWLLRNGFVETKDLQFDGDGRLSGISMDRSTLIQALGDGAAFRTAGCPDCNRPYYNERPGSRLYNYPRPLTRGEAEHELSSLVQSLDI